MQDYDGVVGIYSKTNTLSNKLKEKFEHKYLEVKIFDDFNNIELNKLSYLIINLVDFGDRLSSIANSIKGVDCKILVVHPQRVKKSEKFVVDSELKNLIDLNPNLGILLTPDILGLGVNYNEQNVSHNLIMQSILSERIKIKEDGLFVNTVSVSKLAERIIRDTFSFGISGEIITIIGPRKTKKAFVKKYLNIEDSNIIYVRDTASTKGDSEVVELYSNSSVRVDFSLNLAVKNTKDFFRETTDIKIEESLIPKEVVKAKQVNKEMVRRKIKRFWKLLLITFFVSLTPFYLITISFLLLLFSSKLVFSNNRLSNVLITKSMQTAGLAKSLSFGNNFIYDTANITFEVSSLGIEGVALVDSGRKFVEKITGDTSYDLHAESSAISASLDKIHTGISFLQSDINELNGFLGRYLRSMLIDKSIDINNYKVKIYELKNLFSRISVLLGSESPKKYLILFQNNMELRPTGGFIGSFGLVTFDKGRMSEIVVNDVYMADGQLKGHVDPPEPIRRYLGEGGWYLRDSNWDPNFPVSAVKAEWFLDKEIGEKVDGVIAIDLNFIKRLLDIIGPVDLSEFKLTINSDNLYSVIQSEVESEFFPGSIKKASILTSLSKSLIFEIENLNKDKYLAFFKELYESLERRHIQVYLHDENAGKALSNLNYSGIIDLTSECGLRCITDGYSLIDANLGVNKSNLYIKRSHELNLSVSGDLLGHELLVTYENTASPAVGNMGVYKNYARILLPTNARIGGVRVYDPNGEYKDLEYDLIDTDGRKEAGFLFEVLPATQKKIQIVWNIDSKILSQGGQYNLKVIKQAGTEDDSLKVNIRASGLSLTGRSLSSYNTTLSKDFERKIFFK